MFWLAHLLTRASIDTFVLPPAARPRTAARGFRVFGRSHRSPESGLPRYPGTGRQFTDRLFDFVCIRHDARSLKIDIRYTIARPGRPVPQHGFQAGVLRTLTLFIRYELRADSSQTRHHAAVSGERRKGGSPPSALLFRLWLVTLLESLGTLSVREHTPLRYGTTHAAARPVQSGAPVSQRQAACR